MRIEAQGPFAGRDQPRAGFGVPACKQRDLVALPDQLLSQIGNYAFRPAIRKRWNAFIQRRDLCNFQSLTPRPCAEARD